MKKEQYQKSPRFKMSRSLVSDRDHETVRRLQKERKVREKSLQRHIDYVESMEREEKERSKKNDQQRHQIELSKRHECAVEGLKMIEKRKMAREASKEKENSLVARLKKERMQSQRKREVGLPAEPSQRQRRRSLDIHNHQQQYLQKRKEQEEQRKEKAMARNASAPVPKFKVKFLHNALEEEEKRREKESKQQEMVMQGLKNKQEYSQRLREEARKALQFERKRPLKLAASPKREGMERMDRVQQGKEYLKLNKQLARPKGQSKVEEKPEK